MECGFRVADWYNIRSSEGCRIGLLSALPVLSVSPSRTHAGGRAARLRLSTQCLVMHAYSCAVQEEEQQRDDYESGRSVLPGDRSG